MTLVSTDTSTGLVKEVQPDDSPERRFRDASRDMRKVLERDLDATRLKVKRLESSLIEERMVVGRIEEKIKALDTLLSLTRLTPTPEAPAPLSAPASAAQHQPELVRARTTRMRPDLEGNRRLLLSIFQLEGPELTTAQVRAAIKTRLGRDLGAGRVFDLLRYMPGVVSVGKSTWKLEG